MKPDSAEWWRQVAQGLSCEIHDLLTVLREVSGYLDCSNYASDSGDLPDKVRAAISKASGAEPQPVAVAVEPVAEPQD